MRLVDFRTHLAQSQPIGAYALLDEIKLEHKSAAPPTVYRALDFLMEHGLVHRIQSLNAFVGCNDPGMFTVVSSLYAPIVVMH